MTTQTTSRVRRCLFIAFASALLLTAGNTRAAVELFDFGINIDGTTSCKLGGCGTHGLTDLSSVAGVDDSAFDFVTGLGSITVTVTGTGAHNVDLFLDHELDDAINGFFNETGAVGGTPAAGQSWEIDEPSFVTGDIFTNFLSSTLDNGIGTGGSGTTFPDDVAMAIGFDFTLAAGEYATISYLMSGVQPSGFFLSHIDPDSDETIFFSGNLDIGTNAIPAIPEPATLALLGLGLAGLAATRRRNR